MSLLIITLFIVGYYCIAHAMSEKASDAVFLNALVQNAGARMMEEQADRELEAELGLAEEEGVETYNTDEGAEAILCPLCNHGYLIRDDGVIKPCRWCGNDSP